MATSSGGSDELGALDRKIAKLESFDNDASPPSLGELRRHLLARLRAQRAELLHPVEQSNPEILAACLRSFEWPSKGLSVPEALLQRTDPELVTAYSIVREELAERYLDIANCLEPDRSAAVTLAAHVARRLGLDSLADDVLALAGPGVKDRAKPSHTEREQALRDLDAHLHAYLAELKERDRTPLPGEISPTNIATLIGVNRRELYRLARPAGISKLARYVRDRVEVLRAAEGTTTSGARAG